MPILILDPLLPGQKLEFGSPDPKFSLLLGHVMDGKGGNEIGIIGLNPHTGRPLNIGVTVKVTKDQVSVDKNGIYSVEARGHRRFEVQGEPWKDPTDSFYLAETEITESRPEPALATEQQAQVTAMSKKVPELVENWLMWVIKTGKATAKGMSQRMKDIGPMPEENGPRAMWVASLVRPWPALDVCLEVRPAMLACKNDFDRLYLALAALQSSVDHMSGKKPLF